MTETEYSQFFRAEFQPVVRTAYLVVHDQQTAEDVAQDAFGQLYLHWSKVRTYENPHAWIRRVAIRIAVRRARRDATRRHLTKQQEGPRPVDGTHDLDLLAALRTLPPQQRAAIALHYFEDRPTDEVGELMGCSASTVRSHLARARRRLAQLLDTEEVHHAE